MKRKHKFITNDDMSLFNETLGMNLEQYSTYYDYFKNIAQNLFIWDGLPSTCNAEFLEYTLYHEGRACFVLDRVMQLATPNEPALLNLKYAPTGKLNMYNLPTSINAYSNEYNKGYNEGEFVIIRNNINYVPTIKYVMHFVKRIQNIEQAIQMNLEAQKTPIVFAGSKEQMLSLENLYYKYKNNVPYIFLDKATKDAVKLDSISTGAPFISDRLYDMKEKYKNEFLSFLGINNVDEKAERLLVDEVNSNNQFISLNFETMYDARRKACDEANRLWGTNISVRPRTDLFPSAIGREVVGNGSLYHLDGSDSEQSVRQQTSTIE